jgi:carbon-monoxide dehydrogenase large subunit
MTPTPTRIVGTSAPRVDAVAKAMGGATFGVDVRFPGMLVGRLLRAGVPHARIVHVDTSAAEKLPGVRAILTGRDSSRLHGLFVKDQPALAIDRVRYAGEAVAAVAAEDDEAAQEALERIAVEYEDLPVVSDVREAMAPGAPLLHPDQMAYERAEVPGLRLNPKPGTNVAYHFTLRKGDVEAGFAAADLVVEDTFTTPFIQYAHLEPHVTVARYDADGVMTLWTSTMGPHTLRDMLADFLGLPLARVRVLTQMVGGGYGSKMYLRAINPAAALLALRLPGRHVRIAFDREDEFLTCNGRLPTTTTVKTGVKRDGTLVARQATILWAQGAYADIGAIIARNASYCALGPYRLPHASIDAYQVYTNRQPGGGFRGLGIPQVAWAGEQQMDRVARELGLDPLALRLRNIYVDGDVSVTGERLAHVGVRECLEGAAEAIGWGTPLPAPERTAAVATEGAGDAAAAGTAGDRAGASAAGVGPAPAVLRGRGLACILKSTLTPTASFGHVKLDADGSAEVITSAVEHGQGAHTVLTQIAAEELRIPMDRIRCVMPDTHVTPYDRSSTSSRTTFHMGQVVRLAATDVRAQLVEMAAALLEAHRDDLVVEDGAISVRGAPGRSLTYAQVVQKTYGGPGSVLGRGVVNTKPLYDPMHPDTGQSRRPTVFWMFAAGAAEVEVDPETGQVRLTRLVSAVDAGRAINPQACVQQIEGSAVLGLGMALMEEVAFDEGRTLNPTFLDYKLPTTADMPETRAIIVEAAHADGPYGAKGVGESATPPVPAAVGNAVFAATGVQIRDLPIRAEKVYRALRARR